MKVESLMNHDSRSHIMKPFLGGGYTFTIWIQLRLFERPSADIVGSPGSWPEYNSATQ